MTIYENIFNLNPMHIMKTQYFLIALDKKYYSLSFYKSLVVVLKLIILLI